MKKHVYIWIGLAFTLAGCGHSDLKAPCKPNDGVVYYAEPQELSCGPMRPLNDNLPPEFKELDRREEPKA